MGACVPILEGAARGSATGALMGAALEHYVLDVPEMEGLFTIYGGGMGCMMGGIVGGAMAGVSPGKLKAGDLDFISM